jgi:hypothetical protein
MTKLTVPQIASLLLILAAGCRQSGSPTSPSGSPSPSPALVRAAEPFEVTGVVTDDEGRPLQGIAVTMRHWIGGFIQGPAVLTDAAGAYRIAFSANPWTEGSRGRAAARAELIPDGFEWYYRTIFATGPQLVENFRLHPLQRIAPGDSVVLSLAREDGGCAGGLSWTLAVVCRTVSVRAQANGSMTVQAMSRGDGGQPLVSVCCVSGDDRDGNPVTLPVTAGREFTVEVGLLGGFTTTQPIEVKTSFAP